MEKVKIHDILARIHGSEVIIMGHTHTDKVVRVKNRVEIINVMRGESNLSL